MRTAHNCKGIREGLADYLRALPEKGGLTASPERRFIFMKQAKAAGTSIYRGILLKEIPDIVQQTHCPEKFNRWLDELTDEKLENYFIFSVVRNPFERFVSTASYFGISVKKFASDFEKYCREKTIEKHSLPMHPFTHISDKAFVDFICRVESLQADMNLVFDKIGLERRMLSRMQRSSHSHYSRYLGEKEINFIRKKYQKDLELFGYMYEPLPQNNIFEQLKLGLIKFRKRYSGKNRN